ncbi:uncharacterized protein [Nicotiana tomentosiformis]|uniref:uncharacterized protein n=1 Tax=Nicotiana tomentosiformis TaxID=4098 RepID=UPI00388C3CC7
MEREQLHNLEKWSMIEDQEMQQKSKAHWIRLGDSNAKYFTTIVKEREQRKQIKELTSMFGTKLTDSQSIKEEIVDFYKGLMGSAAKILPAINKHTMRKGPTLSHRQKLDLCIEVTEQEIIAKILASRMQPMISDIIYQAHADFISERKIADNIILAHELVKSYTRKQVSPRCMIKIDL